MGTVAWCGTLLTHSVLLPLPREEKNSTAAAVGCETMISPLQIEPCEYLCVWYKAVVMKGWIFSSGTVAVARGGEVGRRGGGHGDGELRGVVHPGPVVEEAAQRLVRGRLVEAEVGAEREAPLPAQLRLLHVPGRRAVPAAGEQRGGVPVVRRRRGRRVAAVRTGGVEVELERRRRRRLVVVVAATVVGRRRRRDGERGGGGGFHRLS